jgi:UDPglucose 6-dehydrogenase
MKIAIMGHGMVGGALAKYFKNIKGLTPTIYDPPQGYGSVEDLNSAEAVFICVPTPYDAEKGGFDLSYVNDAFSKLDGNKIVVIKSTLLPGTTEKLQQQYPGHKVLFNPEFLTELTADQDMNYPDRQLVGYTKESYNAAGDVMRLLPLAPFERMMPATEAEMVKYYGNTWFSTKVIFANQMYDICEKLGINYDLVKEAAAADKRIGPTHLDIFHRGYRGYGGKCLPKDTRALIQLGDTLGTEMKLLKTVEEINNKLVERQNLDKDR